MKVFIKGSTTPLFQDFRVIPSESNTNILLGRDFLCMFGSVTFDFNTNRVKLGKSWFAGLKLNNRQRVRVSNKTVIPARTERIMSVKCNPNAAFLVGDFEPSQIFGITGVYSNYARVIPNTEGVFQIAILNVNSHDVEIDSRKTIGYLNPAGPEISNVTSLNSVETQDMPGSKTYKLGERLSPYNGCKLLSLINRYEDVFGENPKQPKRNNLIQHKIVTGDSLPVFQKTRRIPVAWEHEVDRQVQEMLNNDVIRKSESPWNSPITLVKKKDNTTRFVCDFRKLNDCTKKDTYPLPYIKDV